MTRGRGGRGRGRGRGGGSRGRGAGKSHPGTREEKASDGKRAQDSTTSQTDGANSVEVHVQRFLVADTVPYHGGVDQSD